MNKYKRVLTLLLIVAICQWSLSLAQSCGLSCGNKSFGICRSQWPDRFPCIGSTDYCYRQLENGCRSLKEDSLSLSVTYPTTREDSPSLTATWQYDLGAVPQNGIKVLVSSKGRFSCFLVNHSITTVQVGGLPDPRDSEHSCGEYEVNVEVTIGKYNCNNVPSLTKSIVVEDCWSVMGNRSLEVCGVQIPSPPVNISAVLSVNSSSNESTLRVTWDPPLHHNTPIEKYWIEFLSSNGSSVQEYLISPNETKYTLSERDLAVAAVRVVAAVDLKDWKCEHCCQNITYGSPPTTYYYSEAVSRVPVVTVSPPQPVTSTVAASSTGVSSVQSSSTPTAPPPSSSESEPSTWLIVGTGVIGGVLAPILCAILVVIAVLAVKLRKKHKHKECIGSSGSDGKGLLGYSEARSVFLVASTKEDNEMGKKMRFLAHNLADHGITPVYFEYERTSHDPHSPAALGIAQWVERQFQRCDLVLFACTQNFLKEWRRESVDVLNPVVWSSRHVLDGILPHQDNMSRFGVVLMGEDCIIPASLKHFQVFSVFDSESDVIHSDQLIRYILETLPYTPPHVSKC